MFAEERRQKILSLLEQKGTVSVNELSKVFAVVPITIRRDLEQLEKEGLLIRIHGGAILKGEPFIQRPLNTKETINQEVKRRIGERAAQLINDGETIILDEGSTCLEVAKALTRTNKNITVVTNGIKVALELTPHSNITTILIGGVCGHQNYVAYGTQTIEMFSDIRAHKYFMGIDALLAKYGISDADIHQVELKRVKVASSKMVIGVADTSKIGTIAVAHVGSINMLNTLIMESPVPDYFKQYLVEERVSLLEV